VVKDTSAAAIVVEQLARLAVKSADELNDTARDLVLTYLPRMLNGLFGSLTAAGVLREGCFHYPKNYAKDSELMWESAYLLMALYYLKTGRVME
jgi:hypothetical protein